MTEAKSSPSKAAPGSTNRGAKQRQHIIDATLDVIAQHGVRGLSHRRVAKEADVSLNATSYYFGSLETLLESAFLTAAERNSVWFRSRLDELSPSEDVIHALATIICELTSDPETGILTYELLVAALPSKRLRDLARSWADAWDEALLPFVADEETARLAGVLANGILQRGLMSDPPLELAEIEALLRRGLV